MQVLLDTLKRHDSSRAIGILDGKELEEEAKNYQDLSNFRINTDGIAYETHTYAFKKRIWF